MMCEEVDAPASRLSEARSCRRLVRRRLGARCRAPRRRRDAAPATLRSPRQTWSNMARQLAKSPFKAPEAPLPDPFANLTYEQYVAIRAQPGAAIWSGDNVGFALEPLHRGFIFSTPMDIYIVENGVGQKLALRPSAFDFGKLQPPADLPDIGFSGFRVLNAAEGQGLQERGDLSGRELLSRQGARPDLRRDRARLVDPHRRSAGRGISALSLGLDRKADARRQRSRHPRPARFGERHRRLSLHVCARRGDDHRHRTDAVRARRGRPCRPRRDDRHLSVRRPRPPPKRPTCAPTSTRSNGLQMLTGKGEWIWRPVANRETLQISAFVDQNPRGFGLLQRNRILFRLSGRRPALGVAALALDRTDRRLGRRRGAIARNPHRFGKQRQHHRLLAAEGRARPGRRRNPSPIGSSGAGRRRRAPTLAACTGSRMGKVGKTMALCGRIRRRPVRRSGEARQTSRPTLPPTPARSSACRTFLSHQNARRSESLSISIRDRRLSPNCGLCLEGRRPTGQRNMALSMDSVNRRRSRARRARPMPPEAPLAMPVQSLTQLFADASGAPGRRPRSPTRPGAIAAVRVRRRAWR